MTCSTSPSTRPGSRASTTAPVGDPPPGLVDFAFTAFPAVFFAGRLDEALELTWIAPNLESVTGLAPGRLLGPGGVERHLRGAERRRYRVGLDSLRRLGRSDGLLRLRGPGASARPLRVRCRLVAGHDGTEVHGCLEPAGAARRYASPARRTPSLSRLLIDALDRVPSAIGLLDAGGRLILCNAAFAAPFGMVPGALIGLDRGVLARAFLDRVVRIDERTVTGSDADVDWWGRRLAAPGAEPAEVELANGEWKLISATSVAGGGLAVVRTDITARKRSEQALRESEALVRRVLEACPAPVSMTELATGEVLYENPASAALFGEAGADGPARGTYDDAQQARAYLEQLRASARVDDLEVLVARPDGSRVPVSLSARLIEYRGAEVIVATAQDLRERRAMEEEMSRQREALHQSEKLSALGELLASVAHELNNPLSVIVGQALLMQETATEPRTVDRARKIGDAAARCSHIVKAFLAMARQQPFERALLAPGDVVETGLELCAYALRDSGVRVTRRLPPGLPFVHGDRNQLAQVITNLILNARQALEEVDGTRELKLTASYRARRDEVVIKVKDSGPGVPEAIRGRIFEPLFTTKAPGAGTGIGLALSHRVVAAHGGLLYLENAPGGGATFCVRLPAARAPQAGDAVRAPSTAVTRRLRVLVIDDEPSVAEMLADVARSEHHEVATASSAAGALDLIRASSFDVVLSDVRMPGMDGPRFFEHLGQFHPEMRSRVIFITGDALTSRVRSFLARSGRPWLEKPVRPAEVRELLARTPASAHEAVTGGCR